MVTYLYCVLRADGAEPPRMTGVGGKPVRSLLVDRANALQAWVATVGEEAFRVSGQALGAQAFLHNEVVSAALAMQQTPLPARFGSHFADDSACVALLGTRATELRQALDRLDGMAEMSVLIVPPPRALAATSEELPDRHEPAAGRRYLEIVRERTRRIDALRAVIDAVATDVDNAVKGMVRGEARTPRSEGIISIAHLLPREEIARYREAVRGVATVGEVRLIVAGPRAPYSFVEPSVLSTGHDSGSPGPNA
jgi:hypothetical protein